MSKSRLSKRREIEAAEAAEAATGKTVKKTAAGKEKTKKADKDEKASGKEGGRKKRVAKPRTRRAKEAAQRRRLVWVVYSSTMREEGRFLYYEKDKAEERLQQLLSKGKRRYFIQPIKEALNPDGTPIVQVTIQPVEEDLEDEVVKTELVDVEVGDDIDLDAELDLEADAEETEGGEEEPAEEEPAEP